MREKTTNTTVILNGRVFDGESVASGRAVVIRGDVIDDVVDQDAAPTSRVDTVDTVDTVDIDGNCLVPGFVDLQVNGGGGVLFNDAPTVETIRRIGAAHRAFGTTGFLPTVLTDDPDVTRRACAAVSEAIREGVPGVLGIHIEGPFLNAEKSGIHDKSKIRRFDSEGLELARLVTRGKLLMTIAPEKFAREEIRQLIDCGAILCAGHSAASYEQTRAALAAGVTGFTHLFNAMTGLQSREPGVVGAALEDTQSWFGIIADGHHVHPATFAVAVAAKQRGGAILVTDAMPPVGSPETTFTIGGERISLEGGRCTNADGVLAGSDLRMIAAVNNASQFADLDWFEAVRMASLYPARALGLDATLGRIRPGYRACFVEVDSVHDVVATWIDGKRMTHR